MNTQLILLGAPGSGKGTQAARLVGELGYKHISTGDLLRSEITKNSDLGKRVKDLMTRGELADDSTVLELLDANCDLNTAIYIFDGFPRNIKQARLLDEAVVKNAKHKAIYFDIDLTILAERIINRRTCGDCGEIYNLLSKAPKFEGICDKCSGTNLTQRRDDNEESVKTRLGVFESAIGPILKYYEDKGSLVRISASLPSDEVFEQVKKAVE